MRSSLRVSVSRVAMVDGTGQRVKLLQWHSKSYPHIGRDQVPTGHAEIREKCKAFSCDKTREGKL